MRRGLVCVALISEGLTHLILISTTSIVHDDIETTVCIYALLEALFPITAFCDVHFERFAAQLFGYGGPAFRRELSDEDFGTLCDELGGYPLAESASAAGDDGDFTF